MRMRPGQAVWMSVHVIPRPRAERSQPCFQLLIAPGFAPLVVLRNRLAIRLEEETWQSFFVRLPSPAR